MIAEIDAKGAEDKQSGERENHPTPGKKPRHYREKCQQVKPDDPACVGPSDCPARADASWPRSWLTTNVSPAILRFDPVNLMPLTHLVVRGREARTRGISLLRRDDCALSTMLLGSRSERNGPSQF